MNLSEIESLIKIRDYVDRMINNFNLEKSVVVDLRSMSILLDNKIVALLLGEEFKEYINFAGAKEAVSRVAEINNVKHSFKTQKEAKDKAVDMLDEAKKMTEIIKESVNKIVSVDETK